MRHEAVVKVTVFARGPYVSFANSGLPYCVGGVIQVRRGGGAHGWLGTILC